ncbi:hypothetical protein DBA29_26620 [Xenophilus aerolatus]|nr:hypothetical protein [Xenophilus aerolatus]
MLISELSGVELDRWVARCDGWRPETEPIKSWLAQVGSYSTSYEAGGPIMYRFKVHSAPMPARNWVWCAVVVPSDDRPGPSRGVWMEGPTRLVASMRAIVSSRFGRKLTP